MRRFGFALVICGAAGLAAAPSAVNAFEIQGGSPDRSDAQSLFAETPQPHFLNQSFNGHSLAMPYSSSGDDGGPLVSDYGNSIPIPGPGIDQPAPAWALSPAFRR